MAERSFSIGGLAVQLVAVLLLGAGSVSAQVTEAATDAAAGMQETAKQIAEEGLSSEVVLAWIVLGAIVGSAVGTMFTWQRKGFGPLLNLVIGGIGAFLGGFVVRSTGLDVGWPRISFKLESLVLAIIFSASLVLVYRVAVRKTSKAIDSLGKTKDEAGAPK